MVKLDVAEQMKALMECSGETRGRVSDTLFPPPKTRIKSDVRRELILVKLGRTPERYFDPNKVDTRPSTYQLTTSVSTYYCLRYQTIKIRSNFQ